MEHELKTWPEYFAGVLSGYKTFEVRRDDRNFAVGDTLQLRECFPDTFDDQGMIVPGQYTGRHVHKIVSYKMSGGRFGIAPGFCVLGLQPLT